MSNFLLYWNVLNKEMTLICFLYFSFKSSDSFLVKFDELECHLSLKRVDGEKNQQINPE